MNKEDKLRKAIGKRIKIARANANFTQDMLAEKTSLSTRYISQLERGMAFGSASTIISICKALNINADFLFEDLINSNPSVEINDLIDDRFLQSYIKLNTQNKHLVDLIVSQLLKFQDDETDSSQEA
jgi:transcriptional regulator with XRE-family HTH domain